MESRKTIAIAVTAIGSEQVSPRLDMAETHSSS